MCALTSLDFFLGANSPDGFYSFFDTVNVPKQGWVNYLLKGGPGTGKSGMMMRVYQSFADTDEVAERIHCSSDPDSLDGMILHNAKRRILDATPPHALEPRYPGAFEVPVNITDCWDSRLLQNRYETIVAAVNENAAHHRHCCRFLKAAQTLLADNAAIATALCNWAKLERYANRLADKELSKKRTVGAVGTEHKRLLSAVTPKGIVCYDTTVCALCDKVYLIKDDFGAVGSRLLSIVKQRALESGFSVYACYCPLSPKDKLEHLLIPQKRLAIITQNRFVKPQVTPYRVVNAARFLDLSALKARKQRLSFNRKAAIELLHEAVKTVSLAKRNHDYIEQQYTDAVDFDKVNALTDTLIARLHTAQ